MIMELPTRCWQSIVEAELELIPKFPHYEMKLKCITKTIVK